METTGELYTCPECDGKIVVHTDEHVCSVCGLIVSEDVIDPGPEWRSFDGERRRTGAPLTRSRHDRGLSTTIGFEGDTRLTGRKRRRVARMRRQHKRAQTNSKADRNRRYAFIEIRRLVDVLSLPERVRDYACILFENAQTEDLLRGRSLEGFAAASVYSACRVDGISRTIAEVIAGARATENEFKTAFDALNRELAIPVGPADPREYLPRFASQLELSTRIEKRASDLAEIANETGISNGRNPCGVAAACLYAAAVEADCPLTQSEIADVADVTPVTLRGTYYELPVEGDS